MKNKKQDPYEVQLADLANEIGGNMAVEYYNVSFTLTKEQLQDMKDKGLRKLPLESLTVHYCSKICQSKFHDKQLLVEEKKGNPVRCSKVRTEHW